jgi:hypothetical protein
MEGGTMRSDWYLRAVKAIDRYGRRLNVDQIDFIADLIDREVNEFTDLQRTLIVSLLGRYVERRFWPKRADHGRSSKSRKLRADG